MTINIKGYDVLIDNQSAPMILARKWHIADRKRGIYFSTTLPFPDGKRRDVKLHRFIREVPPDMLVDHRNGDPLDCRLENLRVCTTAQNTRNESKLKTNKTGHRGVSFYGGKGKYRAVITFNGKYRHLGYFDTPEEAAARYEREARELFGEYYREGV
ncbi:MAG: HNH endonuclease [Treponema sp.]|jgi:hypothetical protein|nr:HNH endonuclease [Treponema sp.]